MAEMTLILGGIKTGKTGYALDRAREAHKQGRRIGYLATARRGDEEISRRIDRHRRERPAEWITLEEQVEAGSALERLGTATDLIILDCLTMLMTNWLMDLLPPGDEVPPREKAEELFSHRIDEILAWADSWPGEILIVSNLVENSLVSLYPFTRMFQDLAGISHQRIAGRADKVVQMTAGLPLILKGEAR